MKTKPTDLFTMLPPTLSNSCAVKLSTQDGCSFINNFFVEKKRIEKKRQKQWARSVLHKCW